MLIVCQANKYEQVLARRAEGISQNLHRALETHNQYANDDITSALIEHARSSIMYERQLLKELEALRGDVNSAAKKVVPSAAPAPRPAFIPKLEDFSKPPLPRAQPPPALKPNANGFHQPAPNMRSTPPPPNLPYNPYSSDPLGQGPLPHSPSLASSSSSPRPMSPSTTHQSIASRSSISGPSSPLPPQSPGAGPSKVFVSPNPSDDGGPPLGGRLVDGTKSMFIRPSSPLVSSPSLPASSSAIGPSRVGATDPLLGGSTTVGPSFSTPALRSEPSNGLDPLGQARPTYMSSSVRVQPTRPRLDAREAASKLANMF